MIWFSAVAIRDDGRWILWMMVMLKKSLDFHSGCCCLLSPLTGCTISDLWWPVSWAMRNRPKWRTYRETIYVKRFSCLFWHVTCLRRKHLFCSYLWYAAGQNSTCNNDVGKNQPTKRNHNLWMECNPHKVQKTARDHSLQIVHSFFDCCMH